VTNLVLLLLTLRWHCAFAQKTSAAGASLSRRQNHVADATLSHKKHLPLPLRFRAKNICRPKHKAVSGRNYAEA
jgi:hypothetical protein